MPRNKNTDSPIGVIITGRLEEMERSQSWLAKRVERAPNTISEIVKGRLRPSITLIEEISKVIDVECAVLLEAIVNGG